MQYTVLYGNSSKPLYLYFTFNDSGLLTVYEAIFHH